MRDFTRLVYVEMGRRCKEQDWALEPQELRLMCIEPAIGMSPGHFSPVFRKRRCPGSMSEQMYVAFGTQSVKDDDMAGA